MKNRMKAIAAIMLMIAAICAVGCKKTDVPNNDGNNGGGNHNNHEYVDLGLPSGTLWATCNVGATKPEGYGDYFAWGETSPKNCYDWYTYKFCNGTNNQLTKYCNDSYYGFDGFADNLTMLETVDDAATVNWGDGWKTPTKEQWVELKTYTSVTWKTKSGIKGVLFTASNGRSIFLPAAGGKYDYDLEYVGNQAYYWTSSLYTGLPYLAWGFGAIVEDGEVLCKLDNDEDRDGGYPVRPVRSTAKN